MEPVQRLRLLAFRAESMDERAFHAELLDIFISLRDLHTNYSLPSPLGGRIAFLGVLLERYIDGGSTRYLVSKKFDHLVTEFAFDVLQRDGTDPRITGLMDRAKLIVVPVVNPDGRTRVEKGSDMWRKNARPLGLGANGVDINRNAAN